MTLFADLHRATPASTMSELQRLADLLVQIGEGRADAALVGALALEALVALEGVVLDIDPDPGPTPGPGSRGN